MGRYAYLYLFAFFSGTYLCGISYQKTHLIFVIVIDQCVKVEGKPVVNFLIINTLVYSVCMPEKQQLCLELIKLACRAEINLVRKKVSSENK